MARFQEAISSLTCWTSKTDKMKSEIQKICEVHDDDSGKDNMESETRNRCEVRQDDDLGKDIISELPDELLHHILSCLPTKDIVRTSALSTRWRWLWTFFTIVSVDFGAEDEDENEYASFLDLVQNKLLIPDTARIRKFRIHLHKYSHFYTYPNILLSISLVSKALKHQVEELELSFPHLWRCNMLSLPHTLFTSESLTSLKLHMSHAASVNPFPTSICFPRLKTLQLICIKFVDVRFAELLFSGCLVLEELLLDNCCWNTTYGITIAIATLQRLAIYHYYLSSNNSLKIRCPNLQFLKFWSCSFFNLALHLPSLIKAHVEIMPRGNLYQKIRLARSTLNLLERIRGVKSLQLSSETLKTISCAENVLADDLPRFRNLTCLKLIGGDCDLSAAALLHILHKSPKLQAIVFPHGLKLDNLKEKTHSLKNAVPACLITSLESFRVLHFRGNEEEVFFLKHILKHATALKWFSVCCSEDLSEDLERKEEIRWELKKLCSEHCEYLFW